MTQSGKQALALVRNGFKGTPFEELLKDGLVVGLEKAWNELKHDTNSLIEAIEWNEPFIAGLAAFHLLFLITILSLRKSVNGLVWMVILSSILTMSSSQINDFAGQHYKSFSSTNYFDKSGVFVVTLFATPMLFNTFVAVAILFTHSIAPSVKAPSAKGKKKRE